MNAARSAITRARYQGNTLVHRAAVAGKRPPPDAAHKKRSRMAPFWLADAQADCSHAA